MDYRCTRLLSVWLTSTRTTCTCRSATQIKGWCYSQLSTWFIQLIFVFVTSANWAMPSLVFPCVRSMIHLLIDRQLVSWPCSSASVSGTQPMECTENLRACSGPAVPWLLPLLLPEPLFIDLTNNGAWWIERHWNIILYWCWTFHFRFVWKSVSCWWLFKKKFYNECSNDTCQD